MCNELEGFVDRQDGFPKGPTAVQRCFHADQ